MKKSKKMYTINKRRLVINIIFLLLVFCLFSFFSAKEYGKKEIITYELEVSSADTLWTLADTIYKNNKSENLNIQNIIIELKEINNLNNSTIYEGQILKIPNYSNSNI